MSKSYKIKLAGKAGYYANKSGRVQHFLTEESAKAKRTKEGLKGARIEPTEARKTKATKPKATKPKATKPKATKPKATKAGKSKGCKPKVTA